MRHTGGWVKLHRSIREKDIFQNINMFAIWNYLLLTVVYTQTQVIWNGKQKILEPGQCLLGVKEISLLWGISQMTVWKWINYLRDTGRLTYETCTRGTLVTICNWKEYQVQEVEGYIPNVNKVDAEYTPSINQVETNCTPSGTYKEEYNLRIEEPKKVRIKNTDIRPSYSPEFDAIWHTYNRKGDKKASWIEYKKQNLDEGGHELLPIAIQNYFQNQTDPKYRKDFERFLKTDWREWLTPKTMANGVHPKTQERLNTFETWKTMVESREDQHDEIEN